MAGVTGRIQFIWSPRPKREVVVWRTLINGRRDGGNYESWGGKVDERSVVSGLAGVILW